MRKCLLYTLLLIGLSGSSPAVMSEEASREVRPTSVVSGPVAVVDFTGCVTDSKYGRQEQETFEMLNNRHLSSIANVEKRLKEVREELDDPEVVDGLSPDAAREKQELCQRLTAELTQHRDIYYRSLNQANNKLLKTLQYHISKAAGVIAARKKYSVILNKEVCFFYEPSQDITANVIAEMDREYDAKVKEISESEDLGRDNTTGKP
ncbi:MAG: OmpH family outer membrane protein [Simkaniaceae bacterium]|nr:OmpH family outer membrane protein [Simkaniaceae bacterium]